MDLSRHAAPMRRATIIGLAATLAGCATTPHQPAPVRAPPISIPYSAVGLERVIGQNAAGLTRLFGAPQADIREGATRKLQFQSQICVLDAYLYPKTPGAEPVVTYLDARLPDGGPIDRASCVGALTRR